MTHTAGVKGTWAEEIALTHLLEYGLTVRTRNYRCKLGEIDLIMLDGETLVFVEVRFRSNPGFGDGAESIDRRKRRRIIAAAQHYLLRHTTPEQYPCRFDVVSLSTRKGQPMVDWIQNAFE